MSSGYGYVVGAAKATFPRRGRARRVRKSFILEIRLRELANHEKKKFDEQKKNHLGSAKSRYLLEVF